MRSHLQRSLRLPASAGTRTAEAGRSARFLLAAIFVAATASAQTHPPTPDPPHDISQVDTAPMSSLLIRRATSAMQSGLAARRWPVRHAPNSPIR